MARGAHPSPVGVAVALSESEPTCVVESELFAELYSLTWCVLHPSVCRGDAGKRD